MNGVNVYTIGHHLEKDSADHPTRYAIIVAFDAESAIEKFREKYPTTRIEEDLKGVYAANIEDVIY